MKNLLHYWKELSIVILLVILAFLIGRRYESVLVRDLINENQRLQIMKINTEQIINQSSNPSTQSLFKQLGYDVMITQTPIEEN